jgi:phosphatidylethanolamine-binding protein (PEBP) family uncharacterized protein
MGVNMKKQYLLVLLAVVLIVAAGCAATGLQIPKDAAELSVDFSWEGITACSHESPEIRVSDIPDGTTELHVRLTDVDMPAWNHGGGNVVHDGSGIVPAGALKIGYNGPCPPSGRHKYEFSVMAVDAEGVIVGFGKARQSFPPKK